MKAHLKYLFYVLQHKWFVFIECCKLGIPLAGLLHDLSKFHPREWCGYVHNFYWSEERKSKHDWRVYNDYFPKGGGVWELIPVGLLIKDRFKLAWNHHQNRNPHHWDYWLHRDEQGDTWPLPMPRRYLKEMLADWRAMSRKLKNDPAEWYRENRVKIKLREEDRAWIEQSLGYVEMP